MNIRCKGAPGALGCSAAVRFAHCYGERMELIEEMDLACRRIGREGLARELDEGLVALATGRRCEQPMADGDAAQIFVGDGNGVIESVEKDCVGSFRTNPGKREQTGAERCSWSGCKLVERTRELFVEHGDKCLERGGLAGVESRGANESLQIFERDRPEPIERQRACCSKVGQGTLDGFPGGVLGEIGAEDDFK
jgi:hypothetical protein